MCAVVKALYSKSYLYHNVDMLHVRVFMYIILAYAGLYVHVFESTTYTTFTHSLSCDCTHCIYIHIYVHVVDLNVHKES